MIETTPILAEGIPPGVIFMIFVAVIVAIANAAAKMKQSKDTQEQMRRHRQARQGEMRQGQQPARTLEEIVQEQLRLGDQRRQQQQRQQRQQQQQQQQKSITRKAKQNRQSSQLQRAAPPPMPAASAPRVQTATDQAEPDELVSPSRPAPGEAARNVRLMLQPSGIREALVLSEVLGKPKSLRDE